ncbi:MAG: PKD domain-containing protein [Minisyncoccia bacterium]
MRTAGLLALVLFLPSFVHAAVPPSLDVYTVSDSTIYPSAAAGSGLATTTTVDIAFSEQVKTSIKILSSDGAMIKSLYSSSGVTNPAPKVWDGKNSSGALVGNGVYTIFISATSTAVGGLAMIDSSKTITVASSGDSSSTATSDTSSAVPDTVTTTTFSGGGGSAEYLPIPTLRIVANGNRTLSANAETAFTAVVYDSRGNKRDDAIVMWSFGDGEQKTGTNVYHTYYDPGDYAAVVHATTADGGDLRVEIVITVRDTSVKIASLSSRGIALVNDDIRTLDLSLWRLSMGGQEFKIPADTKILAGRTVFLSSRVTGLPLANSASLLYPSGEVAYAYPVGALTMSQGIVPIVSATQPIAPIVSYKKVQRVESINSTQNISLHEEEVIAPATSTELAAAGALSAGVASAPVAKLLSSSWTYGLFGIIVTAAGAFILL